MRNIIAILFIQVCLIQSAFSAFSLFNMDHLNNQLSNNAILCMYQDHYGFMWFGTYDGLNLYNGKDVTTFRFESGNSSSLSGNSIHRIMQADKEHLWVVTQIGLDKFSLKERKVVESYPEYKKIILLTSDGNGRMWLMNKDNIIAYYDNQENKIHEIGLKNTPLESIRSMFVDEKGQFCLIKREGKLEYVTITKDPDVPGGSYSVSIKEKTFHDKEIDNVFYEDKQIYFIDSEHNLFLYDKEKDQKIFLRNLTTVIEKYGAIVSLSFFQNDLFIAFLYSGLIKLNMTHTDKQELVDMSIGVFSLLKDRNQNAMWVGTDGRGVKLYYSERDTFGNIMLDNLPFLARRPIRAIYTDEDNTLWIGTKGDGIVKIKDYQKFGNTPIPKNNVEIIAKNGQYKNPIYCFLRSKYNKNDLWIGADKLQYYSYKNNQLYKVEIPDNVGGDFPDDIHTLCEVNDSTLWVSSKGLWKVILDKKVTPYRVKSKTNLRFHKDGNDIEDFFYSMLYDGDSTLTLGSRRGYGAIHYNIFDSKYQFLSMHNADNKGLGDAICLYNNGDSILYIGASSGLTQVKMSGGKENKFKQFGRKNGIINDMIHGIVEDNTGIIWLSTNKGLVKYNPKNDSFFNVKSPKIGVSEFSDNAYWRCPFTNRLFFGGVNGLVWIEPKTEEDFSENEPEFFFTGLTLYGKEQTLYEYYEDKTKKLVLSANQNTFQISFAVLDYINGDNYDYSYKLEEYDTDWVSLQKDNKISFTRIPAGEYTLKIKYKNDVVNADDKIYSLSIVILPAWYLSQIAFAVYFVLFLLLCLGIYFYVRRKFRKKQETVARWIRREQKEKLYESKMKFFTNITHELYTPLTLVNGALSQIEKAKDPEQTKKYITILQNNVSSLNELIQEILDYRKIEEVRAPSQSLKWISVGNLTNELLSSFSTIVIQSDLELNASIPENLYWYTDKSSLKKIVSNLLSNAFKYTPEKGLVKIDICEENECLKIVIYNTGKGIEGSKIKSIFNRYQILEDTDVNANNQMTARNGLGLSICYSMAKLLNGELTVKSEVNQFAEFTVILPKLTKDEYIEPESKTEKEKVKKAVEKTPVIPSLVQTGDPAVCILVVDDNKEIVELIGDILSPRYIVLKAYHVAEALQILKTHTPALIITDIMMPEVDGLSFIRMLREDKYNKQLPIVALSAKIDEMDVIKGYESGADTYLTKPFSPDILLSVVDRFLVNKEEAKNYYNTAESAFQYSSGKLMHIEDQKFIETLSEIVREDINNPDLGPEFIANKMKISPRGLYRQLKKILSISLRDFIKDYRLSYAARLLLTTNLSIKEIIHKIGFSNRSYFYNEFSQKYNMSPKEYRNRNKE